MGGFFDLNLQKNLKCDIIFLRSVQVGVGPHGQIDGSILKKILN